MTNVSVQMSHSFSKIMQQMLQEAKEGRFATKGDAVKRRDQLVGEATPQAEPAEESGSWQWEDGQGQNAESSQAGLDVW